jgi:hypothetical protein
MWMTWLALRFPRGRGGGGFAPRGGVQGCGAGPGGEPVAVGEPGDVTDVGEDPRGDHRPDAGQVHQGGVTGEDQGLQLLGGGFDLRRDGDHFGELLEREPLAGLAGQVPGSHTGEDRFGLQRGDVLLGLSWNEFGQQPLQPVDRLHLLQPHTGTAPDGNANRK